MRHDQRAGRKTYVGFGFGPIQSALFLYEAYRSGNFARLVIAEVDGNAVQAIRENGGCYQVNIARQDGISSSQVQGVELYNPAVPADREAILAAVAEADEIATCLPSVKFFDSGGATSVAGTIAEGLGRRKMARPTIIYTAENHNHAAELLGEAMRKYIRPGALDQVQILNTVIGKMSGVITEQEVIRQIGLKTITPAWARAVLVEEFNRILISRVTLDGYRRGIDVFVEKEDLLPFEEAKLYGHNAIHALIGYLAERRGLGSMAEAGRCGDIMEIARQAFLEESGAALVRRYGGLGDELFTPDGYQRYAEDLLERMVNPHLNDLIARVCRDHVRKLGYEDRLYGTMRLALQYGIPPRNMALGAAAAVASLIQHPEAAGPVKEHLPASVDQMTEERMRTLLAAIWGDRSGAADAASLVGLTWEAWGRGGHTPE